MSSAGLQEAIALAVVLAAAAWLVRRLGAFRAKHPDVDVRLLTVERLVDFAREVSSVANV